LKTDRVLVTLGQAGGGRFGGLPARIYDPANHQGSTSRRQSRILAGFEI